MAFLSLTRKAAKVLKLDVSSAGSAEQFTIPFLEDWIVDVIWSQQTAKPGLIFYNRASGFAIPINPEDYTLGVSLTLIRNHLTRLLEELGLTHGIAYFKDVFGVIHLCKNEDQKAVGYMTQSKNLINNWLHPESANRVSNSYDLMKRINVGLRKVNGQFEKQSRLETFLTMVKGIDKNYGIAFIHPNIEQYQLVN
jgi:hypothetical protein